MTGTKSLDYINKISKHLFKSRGHGDQIAGVHNRYLSSSLSLLLCLTPGHKTSETGSLGPKLEAALNISHLILSTSSQRVS